MLRTSIKRTSHFILLLIPFFGLLITIYLSLKEKAPDYFRTIDTIAELPGVPFIIATWHFVGAVGIILSILTLILF